MVSAREFIEENLVIRTKDARIVPLRLNLAQERLYAALEAQRNAGRPMRVIILKARQLGFSTLAEALIFQRTATRENVNSLVVAHREDSTANLFKMSKLFFERLPEELRPLHRNSNARELVFESPERDPEKKAKNPAYGDSAGNHATVSRGSTGKDVTALQTYLIHLGYSCGDNGADGVFGSGTRAAVRAFQRDHGLTVDGIAGRKTWAALFEALGA